MSPTEFWWQVEARLPQKQYGSLSGDEVADIYDDLKKGGYLENG